MYMERAVTPLTEAEMIAIAPLRDGVPDMYNYMPTRFVPRDEAQQRGWKHFYDGRRCRFGHQAPRNVVNPDLCIDCRRIREGKSPIAGKASGTAEEKEKRSYEKSATYDEKRFTPRPIEADALEKRFLTHYAETKDLRGAALLAGITEAQVHMRLSTSAVFRAATNDLEARLKIRPTVPDPIDFQWDDDKRTRLITVYVDTGDISTARDSIRVTPTELYKELSRNAAFQARLDEAAPLALNALEERAIQFALAGNDKLLSKVLSAKKPEYRERLNVDMNVTEKLTDEQLDNQLRRLVLAARRRDAVDAVLIEPVREVAALGDASGEAAPGESESHSDLL
jgi:hypothetical protein